jgi:hypothetical protein
MKAGEDERVRPNQDDVGRDLQSLLAGECSEDLDCLIMVLIVAVQQGQVGR